MKGECHVQTAPRGKPEAFFLTVASCLWTRDNARDAIFREVAEVGLSVDVCRIKRVKCAIGNRFHVELPDVKAD